MPTPGFVDRAGLWFLNSGIQASSGGVARYYRIDTGQNHPISTEITGYAISTLVYLHSLTGKPEYLERAMRAARFLTDMAWDAERKTFPFECALLSNGARPLAYFFDCGIIARGLLAIWRVTGDPDFLQIAASCGRSMAQDFSAGDSEFHPVLSLPDKRPVPREERWSRLPGCYQLKSALAWYELWEATGESEFQQYYNRQVEYALRTCAGFLPGHPDPHLVMDRLHAYCYFLEGVLPCVRQECCATVLRDGLDRVAELLQEIRSSFERSDVYAQLLRLRCFAEWTGVTPADRQAAVFEAGQLERFQLEHVDCRIDGGFCFGRKGAQWLPYVNPVSAAFGLQALAIWRQYVAGEPPAHWRLLI